MKSEIIKKPNPNDTVIIEMTRAEANLLRRLAAEMGMNDVRRHLGSHSIDLTAVNEAVYQLYKALEVAG